MKITEFNASLGYHLISKKTNTLFNNIASKLEKGEISPSTAKYLFEELSTIAKICIENKEMIDCKANENRHKISF